MEKNSKDLKLNGIIDNIIDMSYRHPCGVTLHRPSNTKEILRVSYNMSRYPVYIEDAIAAKVSNFIYSSDFGNVMLSIEKITEYISKTRPYATSVIDFFKTVTKTYDLWYENNMVEE